MNTLPDKTYVPALRYHWLTWFYDPIIALTVREKRFRQQLIKQSQLHHVQQVLDIGCGTGTLAIWIKKQHPQIAVYGLDGDKTILSIAAQKAERADVSINLETGMSYSIPQPDNSFDRVVSTLFFHHLTYEQKEKTFSEILRVIKPGGELHIADWGKPSNPLMRLLFYQIQLLDGFTTTRDNADGLLPLMIRNSGFHHVEHCQDLKTVFGTLAFIRACKEQVGE